MNSLMIHFRLTGFAGWIDIDKEAFNTTHIVAKHEL